MTMQVKVTKGSVKWFPAGSYRDAAYTVMKQGETAALESKWTGPKIADDDERLLREHMQAQIERDKAAPAVGSASSRESGMVEGEFSIETDGAPILVRVYYETSWKDVIVRKGGEPLLLKTTETNAVTAALYGVVAATSKPPVTDKPPISKPPIQPPPVTKPPVPPVTPPIARPPEMVHTTASVAPQQPVPKPVPKPSDK